MWTSFGSWLDGIPLPLLTALALLLMLIVGLGGYWFRTVSDKWIREEPHETQEAYIVSAVLGLLALLMGFTLSVALDRYETRRQLVLEEANAIGTAYLQSQLLGEPHRSRLSELLTTYLDNRIVLAKAQPAERAALLSANDRLVTDLWAAAAAAFDDIRQSSFSNGFLAAFNEVINLDAARKTARLARVPTEVVALLFVFILVACAVLGNVLTGHRRLVTAALLLVLLALALVMIIDIDRPTSGLINESQQPMEALHQSLTSTPPQAYDKWRGTP